jgi:threonine/homoserine/homoserine lactone efflux protein
MFWQGFQFGMLLQIAVGPVCLFIFNQASSHGFFPAWTGVWAVTLADGLFILAAANGIGRLVRQATWQKIFRYTGPALVFFFGLVMALAGLGFSFLPGFGITMKTGGIFLAALLLTLSNPLSILFWGGVFAARVSESRLSRLELNTYAVGSLTATPVFLSLIALAGTTAQHFLGNDLIKAINVLVGLGLMGMAIRTGLPRHSSLPKLHP